MLLFPQYIEDYETYRNLITHGENFVYQMVFYICYAEFVIVDFIKLSTLKPNT